MVAVVVAALLLAGLVAPAGGSSVRGAFANLQLVSSVPGELTISWDLPDPQPSDYRIMWAEEGLGFLSYRFANEALRGNEYPDGEALSVTLTGLTEGATYKVKARSRYSRGGWNNSRWSGPWSNEVTASVSVTAPVAQEPGDDQQVNDQQQGDDQQTQGNDQQTQGDDSQTQGNDQQQVEDPQTQGNDQQQVEDPQTQGNDDQQQVEDPQTQGLVVRLSGVAKANIPAAGVPTITGRARVGETLTAGTAAITDGDGLTSVSYAYQWIRVAVDTTETDIGSATARTYTLVSDDLGATIKVRVTFTDDDSNSETLTSVATGAVAAAVGPTALNGTVTQREDRDYYFRAADFNFSARQRRRVHEPQDHRTAGCGQADVEQRANLWL